MTANGRVAEYSELELASLCVIGVACVWHVIVTCTMYMGKPLLQGNLASSSLCHGQHVCALYLILFLLPLSLLPPSSSSSSHSSFPSPSFVRLSRVLHLPLVSCDGEGVI